MRSIILKAGFCVIAALAGVAWGELERRWPEPEPAPAHFVTAGAVVV